MMMMAGTVIVLVISVRMPGSSRTAAAKSASTFFAHIN
jgi:hypothetical protein